VFYHCTFDDDDDDDDDGGGGGGGGDDSYVQVLRPANITFDKVERSAKVKVTAVYIELGGGGCTTPYYMCRIQRQ
jgi:hypothetical protein